MAQFVFTPRRLVTLLIDAAGIPPDTHITLPHNVAVELEIIPSTASPYNEYAMTAAEFMGVILDKLAADIDR
jgi:hypothetical protein